MKYDGIRVFMFSIVGILIIASLTFMTIFKMKENKKHNDLIYWEVIDIKDYKENDDFCIIKYLVKINDHDYIMTTNSKINNITFNHYNKCKYCKDHNFKKYNSFCFSTLDGCSSKHQQKINNIKENKIK